MNKLYALIRESAGPMLRNAERMYMYERVSELLSHDKASQAIAVAETFHAKYAHDKPMIYMTFEDICDIDDKELDELPLIYVHMLQALTRNEAANLLNEKLAASSAYIVLQEAIENVNSFNHVYNEWLCANRWIESFEEWRTKN